MHVVNSATLRRGAAGVFVASAALIAVAPGTASADKPDGTCTSSYTPMQESDLLSLPDADLALVAFAHVNRNNDDWVCYKAYPQGDHNGYSGNFVDNTAAPHS